MDLNKYEKIVSVPDIATSRPIEASLVTDSVRSRYNEDELETLFQKEQLLLTHHLKGLTATGHSNSIFTTYKSELSELWSLCLASVFDSMCRTEEHYANNLLDLIDMTTIQNIDTWTQFSKFGKPRVLHLLQIYFSANLTLHCNVKLKCYF